MPERVPPFAHDDVGRLLVHKRCEIYSRVAALIMDFEEALDADDGLRSRFLLQDLRRALRSGLAFLTDEVYQELERLEELGGCLPADEGPIPSQRAQELSDRLQLLHVKLARSLRLPYLQDLEQIVGLPRRLRRRLAEERREQAERAKERALEEQCWDLEAEARQCIANKDYGRALKCLRKAARLDPTRAVFQNDIGVVLSLQGKSAEAANAYRRAVSLNEQHPARRTEEWTTSYYNLGVALRKVAGEALRRKDRDRARVHLEEAGAAFSEYTRLTVTGPKVQEARKIIDRIRSQLEELGAEEPEVTS